MGRRLATFKDAGKPAALLTEQYDKEDRQLSENSHTGETRKLLGWMEISHYL